MFHSAISGPFMPKLPSNLFFLNCSQCRRWPKVPLELFQKIEALTQGWPFLKALALLQGFSPSSRLSIFLLLPFLATSTQLPSSSFTSGAAFGPGLPLFLGLAPFGPPLPLPGGGEGLDCPLLELLVLLLCWFCPFSRPFVCHFSRPFACPFPRPFACPFPRPLL